MPEFVEKKWIFDEFREGSRDLTPEDVALTYRWVQERVLPALNISKEAATPIGSYGKKKDGQRSSDVDVAILTNDPLGAVDRRLNEHGYHTKKIPGLNQVSFALPLYHGDRLAQVDLMLTGSLRWSRFAYHSPDYTKRESEYSGATRTLLMMAVLSESTRNILSKDEEGNTLEVESMVVRLPEGIFSTRRSFQGKRKLLKKARLLREHDRKVTDDPDEAAVLILGEGHTPRDLGSFERIWDVINRPDFVYREHLGLITDKFIRMQAINGLPFPSEINEI